MFENICSNYNPADIIIWNAVNFITNGLITYFKIACWFELYSVEKQMGRAPSIDFVNLIENTATFTFEETLQHLYKIRN